MDDFRYIVNIVGPSGFHTYLTDDDKGRIIETDDHSDAIRYTDVREAQEALEAHVVRNRGQLFTAFITDYDDEERGQIDPDEEWERVSTPTPEQIAEDRACAADDAYDRRRDDEMLASLELQEQTK